MSLRYYDVWGGASVRNFTMVEVVLPFFCPDCWSVTASVDDVDRDFRKIKVYTRATERLL